MQAGVGGGGGGVSPLYGLYGDVWLNRIWFMEWFLNSKREFKQGS